MATFNVAFLNRSLRSSKGPNISILNNQLTMLENSLNKDGYLSPGDYDILIKKAREIQLNNPLTTAQKSNYDVKISNYEKSKALLNLNNSSDISTMNQNLKDEANQDVMVVGNNPKEFIKGRIASLAAKLDQLTTVIQRKTNTGENAVNYYNEYNSTLQEYRSKLEEQKALASHSGSDPIKGYVAYVKTNNQGQIVNVNYDKYGSQKGYAATNGVINGFQVYGKINYKNDGKNYFKLGNKTFSAVDMLIPDPQNPGAFKPNKLMADSEQQGILSRAPAGWVDMAGKNIPLQNYLPDNSWAKGINGSLYHKRQDGGYTKYINGDQSNLPIDGPVLNLPSALEKSLMQRVSDTVDMSNPITPNQGQNNDMSIATPPVEPSAPISTPGNQFKIQAGNPPASMNYGSKNAYTGQAFRTPQEPSKKTSSNIGAVSQKTLQSGVKAFKRLFQ